ncbi:MAG: putative lipid II flippase FtsW [Ectothiorhodospiraceae bacterium]|nr:putative lipid II flippase FtsW [Ectothiorhodospiraceae bacterium]
MTAAATQPAHRVIPALPADLDHRLLAAVVALTVLGLVMVASASISLAERSLGTPLYYFQRQLLFVGGAYALGWLTLNTPLDSVRRMSGLLMLFALLLLVLVLVPGVGREVNGATRWIPMGIINLQVSEVMKLCLMVYLAAFLVRRGEQVRTRLGVFLVPVAVMALIGLLLLLQPDFGAAVVIVGTGLGMLFLAGVPLSRFIALVVLAGGAGVALIYASPYRLERLLSFSNPWADPFNSGFQLTQSLIAIGRGELFGVGLGGSVQKLFYLPEAHTDFVFAVLAEELGLLGILVLVGLYSYVCWRVMATGARSLAAGRAFGGYLCFGVGTWLAIQGFVNAGVNMGLLPTKGLTLPLLSYGGSSLLMTVVALALVLRAGHEAAQAGARARPVRGRGRP